jgi:hypothetical protein
MDDPRFWVGTNGEDILIFDREMQIENSPFVHLWSPTAQEMKSVNASMARVHMKTIKDDTLVAPAIESYLIWHAKNGADFLNEEKKYQRERRKGDELKQQTKSEIYAAKGNSNSYSHRSAQCHNCGKALNSSVQATCKTCGWIRCACGACGC